MLDLLYNIQQITRVTAVRWRRSGGQEEGLYAAARDKLRGIGEEQGQRYELGEYR